MYIEVQVSEIPEKLKERAQELREQLIEKLADFDDTIMEKFLNEEEVSTEEIKSAARNAVLNLLITPVFCGTAFKDKGSLKPSFSS